MKYNKIRSENGVTIIILVVTIIIMLILTAVTIKFSIKDDDLLNKGEEETKAYEQNGKDEKNMINDLQNSVKDKTYQYKK